MNQDQPEIAPKQYKTPDAELQRILRITRRLPTLFKLHKLSRRFRKKYLRKPRQPVVVDVLGLKMRLDPHEFTEAEFLFYPQAYDPVEIDYVRNNLKPGDTFLDLGSNVGFYALMAAPVVGPTGRVLAVEATPATYEKLRTNIELNNLTQVTPVHAGISDKREVLRLNIKAGGAGNNSFLDNNADDGVDVQCFPLTEILAQHHIEKVQGAKMDIEGFEYKVLKQFFEAAPQSLFPEWILIEMNWKHYPDQAKLAMDLLQDNGYREELRHRFNYVMRRSKT